MEIELEQHFHPDSFGYRPNKSAHQAVELVKERCWQLAWVLDIDRNSLILSTMGYCLKLFVTVKLNKGQTQNILIERFGQCQLRLNHQKTKIVYCQSWKHNDQYGKVCFDFLGFTFRPRLIKTRLGKLMVCFLPAISQKASKQIRDTINSWAWTAWIHMEIADIIRFASSKLTGWMTYYGKFGFNQTYSF